MGLREEGPPALGGAAAHEQAANGKPRFVAGIVEQCRGAGRRACERAAVGWLTDPMGRRDSICSSRLATESDMPTAVVRVGIRPLEVEPIPTLLGTRRFEKRQRACPGFVPSPCHS